MVKVGLDGRCDKASIALLSAGPAPVRARNAEAVLAGKTLDEAAIGAAANEAVRDLHPTSDLHGSSAYRVKLLRTMTERGLRKAAERAAGRA
jgi:CO/xanthine dehydrogenase FAD-binding subunit